MSAGIGARVDDAIDGDRIIGVEFDIGAVGIKAARRADVGVVAEAGLGRPADNEIVGIEQQRSGVAIGRAKIDQDAGGDLVGLAADLDQAAIARSQSIGRKRSPSRNRRRIGRFERNMAAVNRAGADRRQLGRRRNADVLARHLDLRRRAARRRSRRQGARDRRIIARRDRDLRGCGRRRARRARLGRPRADLGPRAHRHIIGRRNRHRAAMARRAPRAQTPVDPRIVRRDYADRPVAHDNRAAFRHPRRIHRRFKLRPLPRNPLRLPQRARNQHVMRIDPHPMLRDHLPADEDRTIRRNRHIAVDQLARQRIVDHPVRADQLIDRLLRRRHHRQRADIDHPRRAHNEAVGIGEDHIAANHPVLIGIERTLNVDRTARHHIDEVLRRTGDDQIDGVAPAFAELGERIIGVAPAHRRRADRRRAACNADRRRRTAGGQDQVAGRLAQIDGLGVRRWRAEQAEGEREER